MSRCHLSSYLVACLSRSLEVGNVCKGSFTVKIEEDFQFIGARAADPRVVFILVNRNLRRESMTFGKAPITSNSRRCREAFSSFRRVFRYYRTRKSAPSWIRVPCSIGRGWSKKKPSEILFYNFQVPEDWSVCCRDFNWTRTLFNQIKSRQVIRLSFCLISAFTSDQNKLKINLSKSRLSMGIKFSLIFY